MNKREQRHTIDGASLSLSRSSQSSGRTLGSHLFKVHNVSRGGLRFSTNMDLIIQERISVILQLPNGHQHRAAGRICYCDQNDQNDEGDYYGISFLDNFLDNDLIHANLAPQPA